MLGAFVGVVICFGNPTAKLDAMLTSLTMTSPAALAFVESPSQRTLLIGSTAVQEDPLVRRAVEILYEDLAIFRPAGNLLARKLAACAASATELYAKSSAVPSADLVLPRLRALFDAIDADGDGWLEEHELRQAIHGPCGAVARLCLEDGCAVAFQFSEFVALVAPHTDAADAADVFGPDLSTTVAARDGSSNDSWGGRFDRMVVEFLTWEDEARGSWQGRTGEIVEGCFAGARNTELLEALRVIYCEYAVLRGAGDVVFRMLRPPSHRRA